MSKTVSSKKLVRNSTSAILKQTPEELEPSQSTIEATIDIDALLDPQRSLCTEDIHKSPPSSPGYLDDLLENLTDSQTLGEKLNRVLDNQKASSLLLSKLLGDMAQLSGNVAQILRDVALIVRTRGSGVDFSAARGQDGTKELLLVSGVGFSVGRGQGGIGHQENTCYVGHAGPQYLSCMHTHVMCIPCRLRIAMFKYRCCVCIES